MVAIRISNALRAARSCRAAVAGPQQTTTAATTTTAVYRRSMSTTPRVLAQQGYGDGKGSPEGENPQKEPAATRAQESSEHPGPAAPDVGRGTGGGPTKAGNKTGGGGGKSPEDASAASGGARSKEAQETGASPTGGAVPGTHKGGEALKGAQGEGAPQPKIFNQSVPGAKPGLSDEQKQEVEAHNADFEQRHDRAAPAAADKVNKSFWKGTGGRDGKDIDWNA